MKSYRKGEHNLWQFLPESGQFRSKQWAFSGKQIAPFAMNLYRSRAHHLIGCLSDSELEKFWAVLETAYCDFYMLRAIEDARRAHKPGDTLTREEALQLLPLIQPAPRSL